MSPEEGKVFASGSEISGIISSTIRKERLNEIRNICETKCSKNTVPFCGRCAVGSFRVCRRVNPLDHRRLGRHGRAEGQAPHGQYRLVGRTGMDGRHIRIRGEAQAALPSGYRGRQHEAFRPPPPRRAREGRLACPRGVAEGFAHRGVRLQAPLRLQRGGPLSWLQYANPRPRGEALVLRRRDKLVRCRDFLEQQQARPHPARSGGERPLHEA